MHLSRSFCFPLKIYTNGTSYQSVLFHRQSLLFRHLLGRSSHCRSFWEKIQLTQNFLRRLWLSRQMDRDHCCSHRNSHQQCQWWHLVVTGSCTQRERVKGCVSGLVGRAGNDECKLWEVIITPIKSPSLTWEVNTEVWACQEIQSWKMWPSTTKPSTMCQTAANANLKSL